MPSGQLEDRCLHLKTIHIDDTARTSKFQLVIKHASGFVQKSEASEKSNEMTWECNTYVDISAIAVLEVHRTEKLQKHGLVIKFELDDKRVNQEGNGLKLECTFGTSVTCLEAARIRAEKAIEALESKERIVDKLDVFLHHLDFVVEVGSGFAELFPAAKVAASIVSAIFKKAQDIPKSHQEFTNVMLDIVSILPTVEQAFERFHEKTIQDILSQFVDLVKKTSQDLIKYYSQSKPKDLLRDWYSSKGDDIVKLKGNIQKLKENMHLTFIVGIKGDVDIIKERTAEILEALVAQRDQSLSDADEKALSRLKAPEGSTYDRDHSCHPDTRVSVIQLMKTWAVSMDGSSRLFWLYGVAGSGKSSVAASIADGLDDDRLLSGSFFCKRDIAERRDPVRFVRTMAYLLARAYKPFSEILLSALKNPTILDNPLSTQFKDLLEKPLSQLPRDDVSVPIIVVIDALDECDDSRSISRFLAHMVKLAPWLRLIVTSRPTQEIREEVSKSGTLMKEHDLFTEKAHDDILSYIRFEFSARGSLSTLRSKVSDDQVEGLAGRSHGLFIWIATVMKHVRVQRYGRLKVIEDVLSSNSASNAEAELDALYLRVLKSAMGTSFAEQNTVRLAVGLILVTSRNAQIPAKALHAFLNRFRELRVEVSESEINVLLLELGSLLIIDDLTDVIRALHPSFLNFIGNRLRSKVFWTEAVYLEAVMARACLEIMKDGLRFNICKLESSCHFNSDVKDPDLKERVVTLITPELQYSSLHWLERLSEYERGLSRVLMWQSLYWRILALLTPLLLFCNWLLSLTSSVRQIPLPQSNLYIAQGPVGQMLRDFLYTSQALYWLEAMSLMGELSAASRILQQLPVHLKTFLNDAEVRNTASDLRRFVDLLYLPMSLSTPHIYLSALLWVPSETVVSKTHRRTFIRPELIENRTEYFPPNLQALRVGSPVWCVALSPDGSRIVSGSADKTIRVWDAHSATPVGEPLEGREGAVWSVGYSPDGTRIVSGSSDNTIRVWDAHSATPVGEPLQGHKNWVRSVGYSRDGTRIVSGSDDNTIRVWDAHSGTPVGEPFQGHERGVNAVGYSQDGTRIVSGSFDNTIRVWDAHSGTPVGEPLEGHNGTVLSVGYSPDGTRIVSGSNDNTIRVWDAHSGNPVGEQLEGHNGRVWSVGYSRDGTRIVSGSDDNTIRVWDAHSGTPIGEPLQGHNGWVYSVGYSRDGTRIVSGSDDNTIRVWDAETSTSIGQLSRGESRWDPVEQYFVSIPNPSGIYGALDPLSLVYSATPLSVPSDGWIRTLDGSLLLWIPEEHRHGLCDMCLFCMPPNAVGHPIRIDWKSLCHGSDWTKIMQEEGV